MKIDSQSLLNFLKEKKYDAKIQEETGQIYTILKQSGSEYPLFLRIFEPSNLLQLLAFMPCKIKQGTQADLARLLHLINKDLEMPGFGMDESSEVVFYRYMLPVPDKQIVESILLTYLKSIELICESTSPAILAIATGQMKYSEILQKAKELERKSRINP